ncbi:MAG: toprim domain-containing protein [Nanoarchaeota archaeon]
MRQQEIKIKADIEKYIDYIIVVEGKKDVNALSSLGFKRVYALHQTSVPIKERIVLIASNLDKKDKICILTDLDKKGKSLYLLAKSIFIELGVKLDSNFRDSLLRSGISHIEGLYHYLKTNKSNSF